MHLRRERASDSSFHRADCMCIVLDTIIQNVELINKRAASHTRMRELVAQWLFITDCMGIPLSLYCRLSMSLFAIDIHVLLTLNYSQRSLLAFRGSYFVKDMAIESAIIGGNWRSENCASESEFHAISPLPSPLPLSPFNIPSTILFIVYLTQCPHLPSES